MCIFMSVFRVFVHLELWVNEPVAILYGSVDFASTGNANYVLDHMLMKFVYYI